MIRNNLFNTNYARNYHEMKITLYKSADYKGRIGVKLMKPKQEIGLEPNIKNNNNNKIRPKRNFNSYLIFEITSGNEGFKIISTLTH